MGNLFGDKETQKNVLKMKLKVLARHIFVQFPPLGFKTSNG